MSIEKNHLTQITKKLIHSENLRFSLDYPKNNFNSRKEPIAIQGWIYQKEVSFSCINIFIENNLIISIPLAIERPDVVSYYNLEIEDSKLGFFEYINPYILPEIFELEIIAVQNNGECIKIASLSGTRPPLPAMDLSPLYITTLGRTGSTALLGYLGCHHEVAVYKPFQEEARYISYWGQMFQSLASGFSWQMPLFSSDSTINSAWLLGERNHQPCHYSFYPEMFDWFNNRYTIDIYKFCCRSLCDHYKKVAELNNSFSPRWMVEKFLPDNNLFKLKNIFPSSKEIVLVRDFRDMYASIKLFITKRGFQGFGREHFDDDISYLNESFIPSIKKLHEYWKTNKASTMLVRYEDLIIDPNKTLQKVFHFMEIDSSIDTVKDILKKSGEMSPSSQSKHQTSRDVKASIGKYKESLESEEINLINELLKDALKSFDY